MDDLITGFVALGVACILLIDLVSQIRIGHIAQKLDEILQKLNK